MMRRTLTLAAMLAATAMAPALAMGSGPPIHVPSTWPEDGAFDRKADTPTKDRTASPMFGEMAPDTPPVYEKEEARSR